ncbi:LysR family transcriptional regulator [Burkholderia pseudomallei]|nr:LysR family transcriptional regulator [Burkholderia pseudomallei]APZ16071.1 LysR family transcriptional regulator [Burkholderia pseudomallei]ARK59011.1 LysR family transcriptional regulator [Burkholderia pseudomallei]
MIAAASHCVADEPIAAHEEPGPRRVPARPGPLARRAHAKRNEAGGRRIGDAARPVRAPAAASRAARVRARPRWRPPTIRCAAPPACGATAIVPIHIQHRAHVAESRCSARATSAPRPRTGERRSVFRNMTVLEVGNMSEVGIRNLNHLRVFMAIVEKGSFTAAAECLSMSKSLVSEYLSRLEAEIDTQLVMRSTRRIAPTDAGNKLYCASQAFVSGLYDVIGSIRCLRHESTGLLRVAAPSGFSTTHLSSIAATFIHQHPQIELEIVCNDDEIDLVGERVDLAFETGWPKKKGFRMKMLGAFDQVLVASPEYSRRHAVPRHPDDLPGSHWIGHGGLANLSYSVFGNEGRSVRIQTPGRLKVKSVLLAHQMALAGAGISAFPDYLVAEDLREGRLHRLLPTWTMPKGGIYAFRTAPRQASVRERLFLAAVQAYLAGLCGEHARAGAVPT